MPFKFLASFFKRPEPKIVQDEYLGELAQRDIGCWETTIYFESLNQEIDVWFYSGENPPNSNQIDFYKEVESKFSELWKKIIHETIVEIEDPTDTQEPSIERIFNSLEVDFLIFEKMEKTPIEWEIQSSTELDDNHQFIFLMKGFECYGMKVDG